MAESNIQIDKSLNDIFLEGWESLEQVEDSTLPFNSAEFQDQVKSAMKNFENATRLVSEIGMFSPNELIDEVPTESLQFLLLPLFLGKLTLKLHQQDRLDVLNVAEIYFKDFLQRCKEYELCDAPKDEDKQAVSKPNANSASEIAQLMRAAQARNDKIAQFRKKKELEEFIKKTKGAIRNNTVDEEIKREFFIKFLKMGIIEANEELKSLQMEKQMVEMRKAHMSSGDNDALPALPSAAMASSNSQAHGHHGHSHGHSHAAKARPLQPFIITRDVTQKAVFGLGYPSVPVMTVDEFYQQRVDEGIFPDEEKMAQINKSKALAAAQDPEVAEEEEKAALEQQVEEDDPEYLERMRRMDEYKDVVRRGDGNRYNRS